LATGLVPASAFGAREMIVVAVRGFAVGAIAGVLFAWSETPNARRASLWQFVVAGGVPTILNLAASDLPIGILATAGVVGGVAGGILGAGMLRIAGRAPARER
jgi:hypothetical protein